MTGLGPDLGDRLPTTRGVREISSPSTGAARGGAKDHEIDMNPVCAIDPLVVCRWKESRMRQARQGPRASR